MTASVASSKRGPTSPSFSRSSRPLIQRSSSPSSSSNRFAPVPSGHRSRGRHRGLNAEIKQRGEGIKPEPGGGAAGGGGPAAAAAGPGADLLPAKVMKLLDSGVGVDPAVNAQLQSAINKYAGLRDAIRTSRIDLDTAQAAFNHRYKVVQPAEPPHHAVQTQSPLLLAGGLLAAIFLSLVIPILAELVRESWSSAGRSTRSVSPILAELPFPGRLPE